MGNEGVENSFSGGAIYIYNGAATIKNSSFENNKSISSSDNTSQEDNIYSRGAAVYSTNNSSTSIEASTFSGNSAAWAGAIANYSDMTISGSTFNNNVAVGTAMNATAMRALSILVAHSSSLIVNSPITLQHPSVVPSEIMAVQITMVLSTVH